MAELVVAPRSELQQRRRTTRAVQKMQDMRVELLEAC